MSVTAKKNTSDTATSDLPCLLLTVLDKRSTFDSNALAAELGIDHQKLIGAVKSLQTTEGVSYFYYKISIISGVQINFNFFFRCFALPLRLTKNKNFCLPSPVTKYATGYCTSPTKRRTVLCSARGRW